MSLSTWCNSRSRDLLSPWFWKCPMILLISWRNRSKSWFRVRLILPLLVQGKHPKIWLSNLSNLVHIFIIKLSHFGLSLIICKLLILGRILEEGKLLKKIKVVSQEFNKIQQGFNHFYKITCLLLCNLASIIKKF